MSAPNTDITLYRGVPLNNKYEHSWGVKSKSFISNFSSVSYSRQYWARISKNKIRLNTNVENYQHTPEWFWNFNYLVINNAGKSYYCFITNYEYINDYTVEIEFEVDVLTTYWDEWIFQSCFVEREHVGSDVIGEHTIPEPIDIDYTYVCVDEYESTLINNEQDIYIVIYFAPAKEWNFTTSDHVTPSSLDGLLTGVESIALNAEPTTTNQDTLQQVLESYYRRSFTAIAAFYAPYSFVATPSGKMGNFNWFRSTDTLNGIAVRNKKLFTSPYCYVEVSNQVGDSLNFAWELFPNADRCYFEIYKSILPAPSMILVPTLYNGTDFNFDKLLSISNFPQAPVQTDNIYNWHAQNDMAGAIKTVGATLTGAVAGAVAGPVGAAVGATAGFLGAGSNYLASSYQAGKTGSTLTGGVGMHSTSALLNLKTKHFNFMLRSMALKQESIRRADDFLTRYGYQVNRLGTPNVNTRRRFNYIKTRDCAIKFSGANPQGIPVDASKKICDIFNHGCTIWHDTNIGNYSGNSIS